MSGRQAIAALFFFPNVRVPCETAHKTRLGHVAFNPTNRGSGTLFAKGVAMKSFFKIVLMTLGGLTAAFAAILAVFVIFFDAGNSGPLITFSVDDKQVQVFAPGRGETNFTSVRNADEGQIVVRNRKIALRRDGAVLVDDKKLDLGRFSVLEVYVQPDQKIETRITLGGG